MKTFVRFFVTGTSRLLMVSGAILLGGLCKANATIPQITSVSPISGSIGTTVTISGTNFDSTPVNNAVYFGGVQASVMTASTTSLTVTVPPSAAYAPITETVGGLTAYSTMPFVPTFPSAGILTNSSFTTRLDLNADQSPDLVVIADVDGDGKPDVVVHNGYAPSVSIFRNISTNGLLTAGSFAPRIDLPIGGPQSVAGGLALADLDGDGRLDVITSSQGGGKVCIFQNLCSPGTITTNSFGTRVDIPVSGGPISLAIADLNGDGRPDIVTANFDGSTVSVLRNLGSSGIITTGSFVSQVDFPVAVNPRWVAAADLDGDGKPDLVTVNYSASGMLSVLRNISTTGNITSNSFAPMVNFPTLQYDGAVTIGDMDGDGKPDVVVAEDPFGQAVSVFQNTSTPGSISFASRVDFALAGWGNGVTLGDLDGDGKLDVAAVTQLGDQLSLFRNISTPGSFTSDSLATRLDFGSGYNPYGVAIGDLDGDGRPDIVFGNNYGNTISIYQNTIPFTNSPPPTCDPAPSGLVAWWQAEGNANDSISNNNGSVVGSIAYTNGEVGQAFSLNGSSGYVAIPDSPLLDSFTNRITVECWIKGNILTANPSWEWIVTKGNSSWRLMGVPGAKTVIFYASGTSAINIMSSTRNVNDGQWHHLAGVYDGTNISLYVDGTLDVAQPDTGSIFQNSYPVEIGYNTEAPGGDIFNGLIDEVSIYNRALSSSEIAAIYNAGSAGKCPISNHPPVADASATMPLAISVNGSNAAVVLDGSLSYDPDGDPLQYSWFANSTSYLTNGIVAVVTLPVGTNYITLTVSDGLASDSQAITVDVITIAQAIDRLIVDAGDASAKQSLLATLRAALASIDRSNPMSAVNQLRAFQNQVNAQLGPIDPTSAQALIDEAQAIIDTITGVATTPAKVNITSKANGKPHLKFSAPKGQIYIIEASSDLINWKKIGVAKDEGDDTFDFDDNQSGQTSTRYYRITVP